jgi:arginase
MTSGKVMMVGAPMDLGAGRRGVDMGPSALRLAGLGERLAQLGYDVRDVGNVGVEQPESVPEGTSDARYWDEIQRTCSLLEEQVYGALRDGQFPVVLGGDHSLAMGSVSGAARWFGERERTMGVIWIDAHTDMNTPATSPSGNVHGMPLGYLLGLGAFGKRRIDPRNTALVGLRDIDPTEAPNVRESGVHAFTMRHIDERGLRAVMEDAMRVACEGTEGFHLSFDIDSVDPDEAPGVGTPVPGGLTYREAHLAMEMIADYGRMTSMDIVEVNPVLDTANRTARLAVEFVLSAMGKRIL